MLKYVAKRKDKKHYGAIDGLRTIACFGIVMMHMVANNNYDIPSYLYETVIPSFTHFVVLFMVVSAFGMCCGYYEKVLNHSISVSEFYSKRFKKIWPFFAALVLLDVVISPSIDSLYEAFADLTLLFGLLPGGGNIEVIGVGWFLGVIFVFYLLFPFFCWIIETKKRAWFAFGSSLIYNFVCITYFETGRENILRSSCFFLAGGLIYLYKDEIGKWGVKKSSRWVALIGVVIALACFYVFGDMIGQRNFGFDLLCLLVAAVLLVYALIVSNTKISGGGISGKSLLDNRFMHFFSGISMEIYLSHMVIFRVLEKLHLNALIGEGWLQYIVTVVAVICGASVFAVVMQKLIKKTEELITTRRVKRA